MPDNKNLRHPHDGKRIDINDPQEVRNWCNILSVTERQLKNAVQKVGTSSKKVREYLQ